MIRYQESEALVKQTQQVSLLKTGLGRPKADSQSPGASQIKVWSRESLSLVGVCMSKQFSRFIRYECKDAIPSQS